MNKAFALLLCSALIFFMSCSDAQPSGSDTEQSDSDQADLSAELFDPTKIIEVNIEMAALDWAFIRNDLRDLSGMSGENCMSEPLLLKNQIMVVVVKVVV